MKIARKWLASRPSDGSVEAFVRELWKGLHDHPEADAAEIWWQTTDIGAGGVTLDREGRPNEMWTAVDAYGEHHLDWRVVEAGNAFHTLDSNQWGSP